MIQFSTRRAEGVPRRSGREVVQPGPANASFPGSHFLVPGSETALKEMGTHTHTHTRTSRCQHDLVANILLGMHRHCPESMRTHTCIWIHLHPMTLYLGAYTFLRPGFMALWPSMNISGSKQMPVIWPFWKYRLHPSFSALDFLFLLSPAHQHFIHVSGQHVH
ncbi:unnamed protein product [Protopolystoma xenopodis]|uniref:Uncharacterized protein n=1 Tax=Protopolystoma xenopodis TaxID=117903 RepID=A0A448WLP4_9PLAT|nr:unnamed protein product [Protopolystoma xenopodis]